MSPVKARSAGCSNKLDTAGRSLKESLLSAMRSFAANGNDGLWAELQISWSSSMKALLVSEQVDSTSSSAMQGTNTTRPRGPPLSIPDRERKRIIMRIRKQHILQQTP